MNTVYYSCLPKFERGEIDLGSADVRCQMVQGYVYSPGHDTFSDVAGRVHTPTTVAVSISTDGWVNAITTIDFEAVPAGSTILALIFYVDSGDEATSPLLCHIDTKADTTRLHIATNDGDISFGFTRLFRI